MLKMFFVWVAFFFISVSVNGQTKKDTVAIDTTLYDYEEIFSELDALLDSIHTPRSFVMATVGAGIGYFNYTTENSDATDSRKKFTYSPSIGLFHKNGLGLSANASIINDSSRFLPYQYSVTGSYDYLQSRAFLTGVAFTRYFTRPDLAFYTSPLQNEAYAYFTYRNFWLRPSVAASYGWGSRSEVQKQAGIIESIKKAVRKNRGNGGNGNIIVIDSFNTETTTNERIADLNLSLSVRHDFYFLRLFSGKDYVRLTPQVALNFGTQQFGFNSTSNFSLLNPKNGTATLTRTKNVSLDNRLNFQPLSVTLQLRTEYSIGKFFIQPQVFADYYFPAEDNKLAKTYVITTGFIF